MSNFEGTVLFLLLPAHAQQQNQIPKLDLFRAIINDTRLFYDRDECLDDLSSIIDETIFLFLGPGQSNLIGTLSTFSDVHYIYLSEPHHGHHTTQVRGVFPTTEELLQQLAKDVDLIQSDLMHMSLSSNAQFRGPQTSTKTLHNHKVEFKWNQILFNIILNTVRPNENVYADLLHECRLTYRGNERQTKLIDEFEQSYDPSKAIWWYTRESFLFKILNMALRTENMVIIWKFRFIIQDIYLQLKALYVVQKLEHLSNETKSPLTLYRGQQLSIAELETLKNAEGGLIVMNSFISATKKCDVAVKFARKSMGQAGLKPVIFEICIDKYDSEHDQQPFADITSKSWYGEGEAEILLCMRTVMHIESVSIEGATALIRLRLCRYDDVADQNCDADSPLLMYDSSNLLDEKAALFKMLVTVMSLGEYHRAEQVLHIIQSSEGSPGGNVVCPYAVMIDMAQLNFTYPNALDRMQERLDQLQEYYHAMSNLESVTDICRTAAMRVLAMLDYYQCPVRSGNINKLNVPNLIRQHNDAMKSIRKLITDPKTVRVKSSLNNMLRNLHVDFLREKEPNSEHISTADLERFESEKDAELSEKHPNRIFFLLHMASTATNNGEYDQAIELIRNGLSVPDTNDRRVLLYKQLAKIHEKQGNWLEAIKSHQEIINMPQLPPNSSAIIEAHVGCGDAYCKINEFSQAYNCYTKALDLQLQHYPHNHLQTSKIYISIGGWYEKSGNVTSALENYQKAISMGHPETASATYIRIAQIYVTQKEYDSARSNLIRSLDWAKTQQPQDTISLILAYQLLIMVEHWTKHHHQRDIYIDQLMKLTNSREDVQSYIAEEIQRIINYVSTTNT